MSKKTYYNAEDLNKFGNISEFSPELGKKFFDYYAEVFKEGELTEREKALIALAVSHTVQCPYCIDAYTSGSLEKGATEGQMMEAVHIAAAIRGGASLVHGVQMMNKTKELLM
jgi:alkylhydroperoxidase/carboxymuconolactone decarboxylase family protein